MNKNKFDEKIPQYHRELVTQLSEARGKVIDLETELGEGGEYHGCDCEYCPVEELPELSEAERQKKYQQLEELQENVVPDYKATLKNLEGYAKLKGISINGMEELQP